MVKKILLLIMVSFVFTMQSMAMDDDNQKTDIENEPHQVTITVSESTIHIKNASQMVLEIYNVAGIKVNTQRIDSPDKTVELNNLSKGCYILKIGKIVRKVYLR
ncbi:MAG: T9SS type A sorting domain-containing protein [Roseburia sp.]|nr:T9SS type A sorting domain-containing protein [Roseburia sp.]MCM1420076.1 T9SS type A sorting domain-containing protein [Bacteroides sp.]